VPKYNKLTPAKQALKRQIAAVLHADDERATIGAVADYLGVSCRGLMSAKHDPRNAENSHFVAASTLQPPGYTPAELVRFGFNSWSKVWRPGPAFNQHMDARLQQMFPGVGASTSGSVSGIDGVDPSIPDTVRASAQPSAPTTTPPHVSAGTHVPANPDLTALLQQVAYLYRGSNYPMPENWPLTDSGTLYRSGAIIIDLYTHAYNHPGDDQKLAQWISTHIPPIHQPEFMGCWKLATKQVKAAQAEWENAGHPGEELPPAPGGGVGRMKKRDERETTDPGIVAIGVALDKAEELRVRAVETRAAAVLDPNLESEFMVSLFEFNLARIDLQVAWEAKYLARSS
jgi:hypothetical protein